MGGGRSKNQNKKEVSSFYYFSRFNNNLYKINTGKVTKHKLNKKIEVYEDSCISNVSKNEIVVIGGSNWTNTLTNKVYFINCSNKEVEILKPVPLHSKGGNLLVHDKTFYFVGTTVEYNENSGAVQGGPVMVYHEERNEWDTIQHDRVTKANFYSLIPNERKSDYLDLDQINFNLSSLISPGAFLLNDRIYLLGGKIFDGQNYRSSDKVFSLGILEWDLRIEPFTLPINLVSPQCISKGRKTLIVGGNLDDGKANLDEYVYDSRSNNIVKSDISFECKIEENYAPQMVSDNIVFLSYPKFWIKPKSSKNLNSYFIKSVSGKDHYKVSRTLQDSNNPIEAQYIEVKNHAALYFSFYVKSEEYISDASPFEFTLQKRIIDLASTSFHVDEILSVVVKPLVLHEEASKQQIRFKLNGKTAVFIVNSHILHLNSYSVDFKKLKNEEIHETPPNWIDPVPINQIFYSNWSRTVVSKKVWAAAPKNDNEAVSVCNWGADNKYFIRPKGIMHGWSPLTISNNEAGKVLLLDLTKYPETPSFYRHANYGPVVTVSTGTTLGELMTYLEKQDGPGKAPGWSFPHIPAPAHLTIGGVLAINAHGTGIPSTSEPFDVSYGSLSNHLVELWAVVTDPEIDPHKYVVKKFDRHEKDTKAFLAHLGRTVILKVTLKVIPNYNLRCQSITHLDYKTLFAPAIIGDNPKDSLGYLVEKTGRVEIIWFPFTKYPWTKVWSHEPECPVGSVKVDHMNNYPFSDTYPDYITDILKIVESVPNLTPKLCYLMSFYTNFELEHTKKTDLWGPSKNTLIYVKDQTIRVTANGYAIHMNKSYIQQASHLIGTKFDEMTREYSSNGKWPMNFPLEIRITSLDKNEHILVNSDDESNRPVISALAYNQLDKKNNWDVAFWIDLLTLPGTKYSNEFFEKFEMWLFTEFNNSNAKTYVEWSKGWAYTEKYGPWTSPDLIQAIKTSFSEFRSDDDNWEWEKKTLEKYDNRNIFFTELNRALFS